MKKQNKELVPFNDPAQVSLAFYSISHAIDRMVKAMEAQTAALLKVIREQNSMLEDLADVLRATNEILIQSALEKRSGRDLVSVRQKIEVAKKTLMRGIEKKA